MPPDGPPPGGTRSKSSNGIRWDEMTDSDFEKVFFRININTVLCTKYKSFSDLNAYVLVDSLRSVVGKGVSDIEKFGRGDILIKVNEGSPAEAKLCDINQIKYRDEVIAVKVEKMESLNSCWGIIYAPEMDGTSVDDIVQHEDKIVKAERMTRFDVTTRSRVNAHNYKLCFKGKRLPERVKIAYSSYPVRTFYPSPRSCLYCLKYGHTARFCKTLMEDALCRKCGSPAGLICRLVDDKESKVPNPDHTCIENPICPICEVNYNHAPGSKVPLEERKKPSFD